MVVLFHAFPLNASMWDGQFSALAAQGWRVVAPDIRAASMDDAAGAAVDLLDALHIEDAVVGGCSMGGYLALNVLKHAANYVRGLLLVDTRSQADAPDAADGRKRLIKMAEEQGPSAVAEDMLPKLLGETTRRERPNVVELVRTLAARNTSPEVADMVRVLMSRPDVTPLLASVHIPTLIVVGEEDTITPPMLGRQMHDAIRGSELSVMPRVGHLPNLEEPHAFNDLLTQFLDKRV
ncbi:MAG TPA: alpha/beta fold hydrolase [Vicinamibacterales bacterium]|nr:alpha/beta fold hydrolase [Vicinamibacterales bacterium]